MQWLAGCSRRRWRCRSAQSLLAQPHTTVSGDCDAQWHSGTEAESGEESAAADAASRQQQHSGMGVHTYTSAVSHARSHRNPVGRRVTAPLSADQASTQQFHQTFKLNKRAFGFSPFKKQLEVVSFWLVVFYGMHDALRLSLLSFDSSGAAASGTI